MLLDELRDRLASATGRPARLTWFLRADPQIAGTYGRSDWVAEECPLILRTIEANGDASGVHPHLWKRDARGGWFNELRDPAWTAECLDMSLEAYRSILGRPATLCRFGDHWLDQHTVELMRARGIRHDLTVEPGLPSTPIHDDPAATAWLPDFRGAPREPWVPSREDYLRPEARATGDDAMWMIPLSTSRPVWRPLRHRPFVARMSDSPNLALDSARVWPTLESELGRDTAVPLVFVLRSGDLATTRYRENFLATTAKLAAHPALARCELTTPAEAVARWRAARRTAGD